MRTRVEKCSGGLAVVVPEALAFQAGLRDGGPVELELAGGRLVVRPEGPATLRRVAVRDHAREPARGVGGRAARRGGAAVSEPAFVCPERGHLVWLSLDPQSGHEQAGRRPALVLSPASYNGPVGLALVWPVTGRAKGYPFEVPLPPGLPVSGVVLADHVKCLDGRKRRAEYIVEAPEGVLAEVVRRLGLLLGGATA